MKTTRNCRHSEQRMGSGAEIVSRAMLDSQTNDEVFAHRFGEILDETGKTVDELMSKITSIPYAIRKNYLSHLKQGQVLFPLSLRVKREIVWALGLVETRGHADGLSHDDLDALVQGKTPRQLGMTLL